MKTRSAGLRHSQRNVLLARYSVDSWRSCLCHGVKWS